MKKFLIRRFENGEFHEFEDYVVSEQVLNIFVDDEFIESIFFSNGDEYYLSLGILFVRNIINTKKDIIDIELKENEFSKNLYVKVKKDSKKVTFKKLQNVKEESLFTLMKTLLSYSKTFALTGGTHIVGISDGSNLISYFEDISRLSSALKNIGFLIDNEIYQESILLTSGRINYNIVDIAKSSSIKLIVSQSAVSDLAVEHAENNGITIVGFLRGNRFNIYTDRDKILIK